MDRRTSVYGVVTCIARVAHSAAVQAQFAESEFRAADGTAYQLLRVAPAAVGRGREVFASPRSSAPRPGVGGCNVTGGMAGQVASAIAGVLPPGQILHPYRADPALGDPAAQQRLVGHLRHQQRRPPDHRHGQRARSTSAGCGPTARAAPAPARAAVTEQRRRAAGLRRHRRRQRLRGRRPAHRDRLRSARLGRRSGRSAAPGRTSPTATFVCAPEPSDGFALAPGQAIVIAYNGSLAGSGIRHRRRRLRHRHQRLQSGRLRGRQRRQRRRPARQQSRPAAADQHADGHRDLHPTFTPTATNTATPT